MLEKKQIGQSTQSIWSGEQEHELYERSTQVPVVHSVSFGYKDIETWHKVALEEAEGHIYSRNTNPTVCLLYTSPSPRDATLSRMPSSA